MRKLGKVSALFTTLSALVTVVRVVPVCFAATVGLTSLAVGRSQLRVRDRGVVGDMSRLLCSWNKHADQVEWPPLWCCVGERLHGLKYSRVALDVVWAITLTMYSSCSLLGAIGCVGNDNGFYWLYCSVFLSGWFTYLFGFVMWRVFYHMEVVIEDCDERAFRQVTQFCCRLE